MDYVLFQMIETRVHIADTCGCKKANIQDKEIPSAEVQKRPESIQMSQNRYRTVLGQTTLPNGKTQKKLILSKKTSLTWQKENMEMELSKSFLLPQLQLEMMEPNDFFFHQTGICLHFHGFFWAKILVNDKR